MTIHVIQAADPWAAHEALLKRMVFGTKPYRDYDWVFSSEVGLHNVVIETPSFDFNFNLKRLWLPRSRWNMMVRQYIDVDQLDLMKAQVQDRMTGRFSGKKGRGIAVMRLGEHDLTEDEYDPAVDGLGDQTEIAAMPTKMVQGKFNGRMVRRRWGSCMLSLSYRNNPTPTISLHSRTTYFGYLAAMDIAVAHAFAREIGAIVGVEPAEMSFVWNLELAQFHGFRSLAWLLSDPELKAKMDKYRPRRLDFSYKFEEGNRPGFRRALDGYDRILRSDEKGTLYGDETFSSFARTRRRLHAEVHGEEFCQQFLGGSRASKLSGGAFPPLPDVWSGDLDFSCLRTKRRKRVADHG